jgi:hypothetical protein
LLQRSGPGPVRRAISPFLRSTQKRRGTCHPEKKTSPHSPVPSFRLDCVDQRESHVPLRRVTEPVGQRNDRRRPSRKLCAAHPESMQGSSLQCYWSDAASPASRQPQHIFPIFLASGALERSNPFPASTELNVKLRRSGSSLQGHFFRTQTNQRRIPGGNRTKRIGLCRMSPEKRRSLSESMMRNF